MALQLATSCGLSEYQEISGSTMGTYYRVKTRCPTAIHPSTIEEELRRINSLFSNYDPESSISRFNQMAYGDWVEMDSEVVELVEIAERISKMSSGAFDITIAPLVDLWGFGPQGFDSLPDSTAVESARALVGYQRLEYSTEPPALRKAKPLKVDLSAIAKGYGVDLLLKHLVQLECANILVDIGGEVAVKGAAPLGRSWQIGIETPDASGEVSLTVSLTGIGALATSGNYRNYMEVNGQRLGHTIDPRTGFPVQHDLASVTVIHRFAAQADALATALLVLGTDDGLQLAEEHAIAAIMFVQDPITDNWNTLASKAAKPYLVLAQ